MENSAYMDIAWTLIQPEMQKVRKVYVVSKNLYSYPVNIVLAWMVWAWVIETPGPRIHSISVHGISKIHCYPYGYSWFLDVSLQFSIHVWISTLISKYRDIHARIFHNEYPWNMNIHEWISIFMFLRISVFNHTFIDIHMDIHWFIWISTNGLAMDSQSRDSNVSPREACHLWRLLQSRECRAGLPPTSATRRRRPTGASSIRRRRRHRRRKTGLKMGHWVGYQMGHKCWRDNIRCPAACSPIPNRQLIIGNELLH